CNWFQLRVLLRLKQEELVRMIQHLVLVANAGKVIDHAQLLRNVWGPNQADHAHYLRIYMGHLRHKLEDNPAQPRYMITETGVGYRFQLP
ncbi:winged helix-turn-helix domain-containing protein, partial [Massilia phosphatilytica]